jgi:hypothetical protein
VANRFADMNLKGVIFSFLWQLLSRPLGIHAHESAFVAQTHSVHNVINIRSKLCSVVEKFPAVNFSRRRSRINLETMPNYCVTLCL